MRFGKTILAKALDLAIHALGKFLRQAALHHAIAQLLPELLDESRPAPGGHGTAELIRLPRCEAGRHHGQTHRLFLKERYAKGFLQDLLDLGSRIKSLLLAVAPP